MSGAGVGDWVVDGSMQAQACIAVNLCLLEFT